MEEEMLGERGSLLDGDEGLSKENTDRQRRRRRTEKEKEEKEKAQHWRKITIQHASYTPKSIDFELGTRNCRKGGRANKSTTQQQQQDEIREEI